MAEKTEMIAMEAMPEIFYLDAQNLPQATSWTEIFSSVGRIKAYFQAISQRFSERELILERIMYAMMMREHIMITGPTGAAKTLLINTVFSGILGAHTWSMQLTKSTTDSHIFGSYDVRQMRKSGHMIHMTEGSIAEAHFANIGEFFDANDSVLRALLGVLNERVVKNGPQIIRPPLLSAIADTNFDPQSLSAMRRETLSAVVDRFLFRTPVQYVRDPKNRLTMLEMSLNNVHREKLPDVKLDDFVIVSGVVCGMNLVQDPYVIQAYEEMTRLYSKKLVEANQPPISDRRFVRGGQIMEISALLHRRKTATFEDLELAKHLLTASEADVEILNKVRQEILGEWVKKANNREVESELHRFAAITRDIPKQPNLEEMSLPVLERFEAQISAALDLVQEFQTDLVEVNRRRTTATRELYEMRNNIHERMLALLETSLPDIPEDTAKIPSEELIAMMSQSNSIIAQTDRIIPRSEAVFLRHTTLLDKATTAKARLKVAFDLVMRPPPPVLPYPAPAPIPAPSGPPAEPAAEVK